ncbi:hypothetical protein quinque_002859 [Culex quinquefasciatus]
MNPLLTILAGACLLLALSQQLIGAEAQAEVTSAAPTVTGESTTTKDAGDSPEEDKSKGGKGHGCFSGFTGGKVPGGIKGDQKKPMGDFHKFGDKLVSGQQKPGQIGMQAGGHQGPMGGFGGNRPGAGLTGGATGFGGPGAMRRPTENKPQ